MSLKAELKAIHDDVYAPVMRDFRMINSDRCFMSDFAPSMTRQEFAEECDINTLMARYEAHGVISHVNRAVPVYMDLTGMPDLRESLDYMRDATLAFNSLPAAARYMLGNDPVKFVEFATNPDNIGKMREWGLAPPVELPAQPILVKMEAPIPAPGDADKK